jgi:TonB family protein
MPSYWLEVGLRAAALGLAAAPLAWLLRRRGAELRHALWGLVLAGMILLPLLTAALPRLRLLPPREVKAEPVLTAAVSGGDADVAHPAPAPVTPGPDWVELGTALYCLLALAGGVRIGMKLWRAGQEVRRGVPPRGGRAPEVLEEVAAQQRAAAPLPELLESASVRVPFTAGWGSPTIVLPEDWQGWDDLKLRAVLAHELAHARRGDWATAAVAALNRAIFWYHPLAWWLERRLAGLAEESCDAAAMAAVGDARGYARTVLDFAVELCGRREPAWQATAMARSSKVGRRIDRILEGSMNTSCGSRMKRAVWVLLIGAAVPAIYAAAALDWMAVATRPEPQVVAIGQQQIPGATLTSAQAAGLEARLVQNAEDLEARGQLLGYYFSNRLTRQWMEQVFWLTERHPESAIHDSYAAAASRSPEMLGQAEWARLADVWRQKARENASSVDTLLHAARFLRAAEPATAAEYLTTARAAAAGDPRASQELESLYASAALAAARGGDSPLALLGRQVTPDLLNGRDAALVGRVGIAVGQSAASAVEKDLALRLLGRAAELEPANGKWSAELDGLRSGTQSADSELTVVKSVAPVYPPLAKQARIQGVVALRVTVGQDGTAAAVEVISGHPLLVRSAQDAVRQYGFAPSMRGKTGIVRINFTLMDAQPAPASITATAPGKGEAPPKRITVGGNVQQSMLVSQVAPVYPPLAKAARIQGSVRLQVLLSREGEVSEVSVVSGHPLLVQAAVEAVKQWKYRTTLLNGQPVEVMTQVDVNFTLDDKGAAGTAGEEKRLEVGGSVQQPIVEYQVAPDYPPLAKAARIQGTVRLQIVIGKDGTVKEVQAESGHPLLVQAAVDAVRQWRHRTTLLNGEPVEVKAKVELRFELPPKEQE